MGKCNEESTPSEPPPGLGEEFCLSPKIGGDTEGVETNTNPPMSWMRTYSIVV